MRIDKTKIICNTENMDATQQSSAAPATPSPLMKPQSSFRQGWIMFKSSLLFLFRRPSFLVPLFAAWIVFAAITLYLRYLWTAPQNAGLGIFMIFLFVFVLSYTICLANLTLLELIKQVEDNKTVSFVSAFGRVLSFDSIKVIPLAVFFAIVWFLILVLKALTSKRNNSRAEPSIKDAALTLGGISSSPFSWLGLGLDMFEKLLRMTIFLALPAICWEGENSFSAFREAVEIIKKHPVQFLTEYALTGTAAIIMAIPLVGIGILSNANIAISDTVWLGVIIYEGITWTLNVYLEQMSVSLLYLWHLKWKNSGAAGDLSVFTKPDLLADFHELKSTQV